MSLNKSKGNMYNWITHTWNPIKGECIHDCIYCYMKKWGKLKPLHLDEKDLRTDLGHHNFIFIGSSTDMFARNVPADWIKKVLSKCKEYFYNFYLFQSKNPARMLEFFTMYDTTNMMLGTTIETNRDYNISKAPSPLLRAKAMEKISLQGFKTMVTIEPIMDFDIDILVKYVLIANPEFVNIGADSCGHNLPEPSKDKISRLICELKKYTKIREKHNLKRLR